jgi:hypothetical protein
VGGAIVTETVTLMKGTPEYEREREGRIQHTKWDISNLKDGIKHQAAKIRTWKPQELAYGRGKDKQ